LLVEDLLNNIKEKRPDIESLALVDRRENDIKQMKEFNKEETLGTIGIHRYQDLQFVPCKMTVYHNTVIPDPDRKKGSNKNITIYNGKTLWLPSLKVTGKEIVELIK